MIILSLNSKFIAQVLVLIVISSSLTKETIAIENNDTTRYMIGPKVCNSSISHDIIKTTYNNVNTKGNDNNNNTSANQLFVEVLGYNDMKILINDMQYEYESSSINKSNSESKNKLEYVYKLCPNTIFSMSSNTKPISISPLLSNTKIQCGNEGDVNDNCTINGGATHVYFPTNVIVTNVTFNGITFMNNNDISIRAWSNFSSYAFFLDCHWKFNYGYAIVETWYQPEEHDDYLNRHLRVIDGDNNHNHNVINNMVEIVARRKLQGYSSMRLSFIDCTFQNNNVSESLLSSVGGYIGIYGCIFIQNIAHQSIIHAIMNSHLNFHYNTTLYDNTANDYIVFIDNDSYLDMNSDSYSWNNTISSTVSKYQIQQQQQHGYCSNGIFMEIDHGSYCRYKNGLCVGTCCNFGNTTCDDYTYDFSANANMKNSNNTITSRSKSKSSIASTTSTNDNILSHSESSNKKNNRAGWIVAIIILCTALIVVWVLAFTIMIHGHKIHQQAELNITDLDISDSTVELS